MLNVGEKIRQLRLKNQMTQEDVAVRTNLSAAFISQLETGKTSINVDTLNNIISVLGSSLSVFFHEEKEDNVVYKKASVYKVSSSDYNINWLINDSSKRKMEPIIIEIVKGGESEVIDIFDGEAYGYVLEGKCTLIYGEEKHDLVKEDSFYIKTTKPHKILCEKESAKVLWVTNPPYF